MILNLSMNLLMILFLMTIFMFTSFYKHLLVSLISLEFVILTLSLNLYMNFVFLDLNLYFISFFWVVTVCESIMGLTLLVYMVRKLGNDYTKLMNLIN